MTEKSFPAFSLLEVAIALCVLGIVGAFSLSTLERLTQYRKIRETEHSLDQITKALVSHVFIRKRLPYAARPGTKGYGKGMSEEGLTIGVVPYRTLGLPEESAKDGYRHWITYAVEPSLADLSIRHLMTQDPFCLPENVFCEIKRPLSVLEVRDQEGRNVLDPSLNEDFVAFVLVSHGPKGEGAFTCTGSRVPTHHRDKKTNSDHSLTFIDRPLSRNPDSFFDDVVRWVTRNNLLALYGKEPCQKRGDLQQSMADGFWK